MADIVPPDKRSEMMSGIKGKNTKPEIYIRKLLHRNGFRFVLGGRKLPGKPDIVLPKYKVVIFVHGCFWHGHSSCYLFRLPKSREEFWKNKIQGNIDRDARNQSQLEALGWRVCTAWECAIKGKGRIDEEALVEGFVKWIGSGRKRYVIRSKA